MNLVLAIVIGGLFATGLYLLLRRSVVRIVLGLAVLGHAANLLIFTVGGLARGEAPIVAAGEAVPPAGHADPVPQALILTAIVIGFAVVAFAAILVRSVYATLGTGDIDEMRSADQ